MTSPGPVGGGLVNERSRSERWDEEERKAGLFDAACEDPASWIPPNLGELGGRGARVGRVGP